MCEKSQEFLAKRKVDAAVVVDARKQKFGRADALRLARSARRVVASSRWGTQTFDMRRDAPGDRALLAALLGPTGNLRAPVVRVGDTLLVGFNEAAYAEALK